LGGMERDADYSVKAVRRTRAPPSPRSRSRGLRRWRRP
jgi:hypothetical protein